MLHIPVIIIIIIIFNEEWTQAKINCFQINQFGQVYDTQFPFHAGARKWPSVWAQIILVKDGRYSMTL